MIRNKFCVLMQALGAFKMHTPGDNDDEIPESDTSPPPRPKEESKKTHPELEPEPEPMDLTEDERERKVKKEKAQKEKEAGNAAYKKKDFDKAIAHYTKAMELDDEDISHLTNRAAVYLEMGKGFSGLLVYLI